MNITIIDDDNLQTASLKAIIMSFDHSVELSTFENPIEAINTFYEGVLPDILFLDIHMPLMDGWEFLDLLKSEYPDLEKKLLVYIITSSAKITTNDLKKYPVVKDVIKKPVSIEQLKKAIG